MPPTAITTNRSFDCPVSILVRDANRLRSALVDPATGPAVGRRLAKKNRAPDQSDIVFAPSFEAQIQLVEMCQSVQNAARLAYPSAKAVKDEAALVARNRLFSTGSRPAAQPEPKKSPPLRPPRQPPHEERRGSCCRNHPIPMP